MGGLSFMVGTEEEGVVESMEVEVGSVERGGSFQRSRSLSDGSEDNVVSLDDEGASSELLLLVPLLLLC